jgi:hypothetical protein
MVATPSSATNVPYLFPPSTRAKWEDLLLLHHGAHMKDAHPDKLAIGLDKLAIGLETMGKSIVLIVESQYKRYIPYSRIDHDLFMAQCWALLHVQNKLPIESKLSRHPADIIFKTLSFMLSWIPQNPRTNQA